MLHLVNKLYYCNSSPAKCSVAARHQVFSNVASGACCEECQQPYKLGGSQLNFKLITPFVFFIIIAATSAYLIAFPHRISDVNFVKTSSHIAEDAGTVIIEIKRDKKGADTERIKYKLFSGTALAGKDFGDVSGEVVFSGETLIQNIEIPIIRDRNDRESDESFEVQLTNVEGTPRHQVIISEPQLNKKLLDDARVLVGSLSSLAADLANTVKEAWYLQNYLRTSEQPSDEIIQRYREKQGNLSRGREKYLLLIRDATELDSVAINSAIDNLLAELKVRGFALQYKATITMRSQLDDFRDTGIPKTDAWLLELGNDVKDVKDSDSSENSLSSDTPNQQRHLL